MLIFTLQFLFQLSRSLGTRYLAEEKVWQSVVIGFIVQCLWLATTYLGVKAVGGMDWLEIIGYLSGGCLGVYVNFKIKRVK